MYKTNREAVECNRETFDDIARPYIQSELVGSNTTFQNPFTEIAEQHKENDIWR